MRAGQMFLYVLDEKCVWVDGEMLRGLLLSHTTEREVNAVGMVEH